MTPPPPDSVVEIYLDPAEADERRRLRAERYNAMTIPSLRLLGFQLLAFMVILHNRLVLGDPRWDLVIPYIVTTEVYSLVSWLALRRFYRRSPWIFPLALLCVDVVLFTSAVYVSGGHRSWLFPVAFMHVADQTATTFRRVIAFAHLSVACYVGMLLLEASQPGSSVEWSTEVVKIALLYTMGVYTSFTARTAERLRDRLVDTVRTSRDLVARLEQSSIETQRALDLSEVANRSKNRFLANMSHELRTPLNSVIGFADVLLKNRGERLAESDLVYLRRIKDNGVHLLDIISDILDLSRIEEGRLEVEMAEVDIEALVAEVVESFGSGPRTSAVKLTAEMPVGLETIRTDRTRLRQVLTNLVGNALKFTSEGTVRLRVVADGNHPHAVEVVDTGIGIAPDRLLAVFQPFEQEDNTTRRRYGGTGLGLSISKSLCGLIGCRLEAESEPGRGSTFRVILPQQPPV